MPSWQNASMCVAEEVSYRKACGTELRLFRQIPFSLLPSKSQALITDSTSRSPPFLLCA